MATIDLGRLGFVNKGTYNNSTTYEKNDLVQFTDGGILSTYLYIDSSAQSGQAPSSSGTAGSRWVYYAKGGSAGTDVAATLANKEISFKTNAGALDGVPIGTAGQFLKVNSGATGYEFGAVSSDYVLLSTSTFSGAATAVDNVFTNDYKFYQIKIEGLYGNTDGEVQFNWRYGGASGNSSTSSTYRHFYNRAETNGSSTSHDATLLGWNNNHGKLFQSRESGTSLKNYNATMDVYNPFKNSWTYWNCRALGFDNSGTWLINYSGGGVQADSTSITGIRINAGAGDHDGGTMKIYGLK